MRQDDTSAFVRAGDDASVSLCHICATFGYLKRYNGTTALLLHALSRTGIHQSTVYCPELHMSWDMEVRGETGESWKILIDYRCMVHLKGPGT